MIATRLARLGRVRGQARKWGRRPACPQNLPPSTSSPRVRCPMPQGQAGRLPYFEESILDPQCRHGTATVLLRGCEGVASVLFPWVSLVQPLYIPYLSLIHPLFLYSHSGGSTAHPLVRWVRLARDNCGGLRWKRVSPAIHLLPGADKDARTRSRVTELLKVPPGEGARATVRGRQQTEEAEVPATPPARGARGRPED